MNTPDQPSPPKDETTVLHLNKFAHGHGSGMADESSTMFIKRAATEAVQQQGAKPVIVPQAAGPIDAEEMLGTVAYCYAKGVYSSSDIEQRMLRDPEFRAALGGVVPEPAAIRRFRRLNREAIQAVLEKFYRRLRHHNTPKEVLPGATPPEPPPVLPSRSHPAPRPEENTAHFVKREASERLDKASFIDGMSSDT